MKATDSVIPKALAEVWEWKDAVYEDTKDKTLEETKAYFREGLEEAARILGARLERSSDGSYRIVRIR